MKIVVIGIGLIGGSLVRDLRGLPERPSVLGMDKNPDHLDQALSLGLIDAPAEPADLATADLVIVSIPVDHVVRELPGLLAKVGEETLVIDAGSTKAPICQAVSGHEKRRNFLACHPIAGTEFTGPDAAISGLFQGKVNIICEVEQTAFRIQERALELFRHLGMRIRYMSPEAHDRHIAYVSHLSHISSFMLGKTVIEKEQNERDIFDMAGSGFESTVRLAKSSPAMWTPIFEQNRENVLETLDEYIANLQEFSDQLRENRYEDLYRQMDNTNRIKDILKGIPQQKQE
ncbi:prephenate dehydrogenase [Robiginitalea myxolifaciens]|uniref:Prephenate dehydrogenase n=1 Tax=Robiginitalea myxolifaciens TaxID=400055 RepID=A0A1I6FRL1_9FLAO|nr:prephenate dehydrogenase [Robiginitalea myxolifaciens]SFR32538.1 prephenate dehydrogenase [Robiginitalea myxolifaciens]